MRWFRYLFLFSIIILGIIHLAIGIQVLNSDLIYKKDILVEHLVAKAVFDGIDPYTPLDELAARYIGPITYFPHPMPYPPPAIIISLPLGLLDARAAATVWFLFEVICITFIAYMSLKLLDIKTKAVNIVLTTAILFAWHPFWEDLLYGQLSILIATFIFIAIYLQQKNENFWAGVVLGLPIAIKLFGWLLLIFFILKKNWKLAIGSGAALVITHFITGILIGFNQLINYYWNAITNLSDSYRAFAFNYSLWTVGWRFFSGTESDVLLGVNAPPLIESPSAAGAVSILLPLIYILIGLRWGMRAKDTNTALAILLCVSVLVNPIVWVHYFVILLFPIVVLMQLLRSQSLPAPETMIFLGITAVLFFFDNTAINNVLKGLSPRPEIDGNFQVSFAAGLITMIPPILIICYSILLRHLDKKP